MDARQKTTGVILALGALVLAVLATVAMRLTASSEHSAGATVDTSTHDHATRDAAAVGEPGANLLATTKIGAASPRTSGTTAARSPRDPDGDATSGPQHECDSTDANGTASSNTPRIAGAIRGLLVREGGPWTAESLPKPNMVMLDLVATVAPHANRRGTLEQRPDANGHVELVFAFEDVPEGEYELSLSSLDSRRWSPISLHVRPPLDGVTFTRYDKDPALKLRFEVFDAEFGTRIESFQTRQIRITPSLDAGVFLHTGPLDVDEVPLDARFTWSLWADGFAPAFGNETAFVRGSDARTAHVELARGWSTEILALVRDPQARQAAGAEILVDGHRAGFTGADGLFVVHTPTRPGSLEVRLSGWKSRADPLEPYAGKTAEERGQVTIVMLDRE